MRDQMQDGMAEATRLTCEGRLDEAMAVIQRTLGGAYAPTASPESTGGADRPVEATFEVVDEAGRPAPAQAGASIGAPVAAKPPTSGGMIGDLLSQAAATIRRAVGDESDVAATLPASEAPLSFRGVPHLLNDLPSLLPGGLPGTTVGADTPAVVPEGGQFLQRSYTDQTGTRSYKLYVPSGYVGQATPLIVMLHGCTQSPDDFATGTHMNALAEEHTLLVAYPMQSQNANISKCWNWFKTSDQQRGRGEPSLIAGITRQIIDEYNVADDRVYVAGMSAGGAMAAIMGETYPDLYAAVGVHSGLAPGAAQDLASAFSAMQNGGTATARRDTPIVADTRVVPTIVFHGDRDTTVHPRNADQLLAHLAANNAASRDATGASLPPAKIRQGKVPGGHAYTQATHHDADGRSAAERWTVQGLGHCWSGGSAPGSYTDPNGPDASAEMVRFFDQHPRRDPTEQPAG